MPTYEYQCGQCGHQVEVFQKMSDAPLTECPECHQSALNKLISGGAFQLKGSGWYVTDYSKKNKPKSEPSKSEGSNGGTGDAKSNGTASNSSTSGST